MGSHSWWLQQLFYMQWLFKSVAWYSSLCSSLLRSEDKHKEIWTYPPLKVQSGSHPAFLMMYNVCWQGLFEECELIFRSIKRSVGNYSPFSVLGGWTFPIAHVLAAVHEHGVHGETQNITGLPNRRSHPLATCQVFVCWGDCSRADRNFPMTGKGDGRTDWL